MLCARPSSMFLPAHHRQLSACRHWLRQGRSLKPTVLRNCALHGLGAMTNCRVGLSGGTSLPRLWRCLVFSRKDDFCTESLGRSAPRRFAINGGLSAHIALFMTIDLTVNPTSQILFQQNEALQQRICSSTSTANRNSAWVRNVLNVPKEVTQLLFYELCCIANRRMHRHRNRRRAL
jgi:hypothetical protein